MLLETLFGAAVGGACFRIRGGWLGDSIRSSWLGRKLGWGIGTARIVAWGIPTALIAAVALHFDHLWLVATTGILQYLAATAPTMNALDAGRNDGSIIGDFFANMARGLIFGIPLSIILFLDGGFSLFGIPGLFPLWWLPAAAGACMSLAYELSWRFVKVENTPSNYAEVIFGVLMGAAIAASLSFGG